MVNCLKILAYEHERRKKQPRPSHDTILQRLHYLALSLLSADPPEGCAVSLRRNILVGLRSAQVALSKLDVLSVFSLCYSDCLDLDLDLDLENLNEHSVTFSSSPWGSRRGSRDRSWCFRRRTRGARTRLKLHRAPNGLACQKKEHITSLLMTSFNRRGSTAPI